MKRYFASEALLPIGWAQRVLIQVDEHGNIAHVAKDAASEGSQILAGPVLPGMANAHSHAFQRAMAGMAETRSHSEDDFWTWRELMYKFVSRITPEQAFAIARQTYIELLKSG